MYVYNVSLLKKEQIGAQAFQLTFKFPDNINFEFKPGQYIWLVLPKLDFPDPRGERRAFSITSNSVQKNQITILVRVSDSGYKKTLFNLPENSSLQIIGPFGSSYVINPELNQNIVMIAGGVGIAPFSSILRSHQSFPTPQLNIVYCCISSEVSCFTPDLDQICSQNNFQVTKHLGDFRENILPPGIDYANDQFFVCGPEAFINSVYLVLSNKNIPLPRIHLEQFYPTPIGNLTELDFTQKQGERNIMLQAIQDSKNHVVVTDANGKIIFANLAAEKNTGFSFDEMRGNTPRLWGGLMQTEFYQSFWQGEHEAVGFDGTITNRRKNNETYHVIAHISPIFGENRNIIGFIGTEEDISERILLETELKSGKAKDEAILAGIGDGLVVVDTKGKILMVNKTFEEMLGWKTEEVVGRLMVEVVSREDEVGNPVPFKDRILSQVLAGKKIITTTTTTTTGIIVALPSFYYVRKDKSRFPAASVITPVVTENKIIGAIEVFRDITKEREIDKAKTEFISLASHQLRTPLSTINWYTESLLSGENGQINANQKQFLDEIYTASQRMVTLVNSLLNVSRIELGTFIIEPVPTDIVSLLESEIAELSLGSKAKNIQIILSKNIEHLNIPIDSKLMRMVFQNIIDNAIKYSAENTTIEITLNCQDQNVNINVADHGIGIPEKSQFKIFSRLFRADNAKVKITDGNGLGLYLVKMIMDESGGGIRFESVEGKGTIFYITLPLSGMIKKDGTKKLD